MIKIQTVNRLPFDSLKYLHIHVTLSNIGEDERTNSDKYIIDSFHNLYRQDFQR